MNINLNKKILDILACPICKQDIEIKEDKIICKKCKKEYFIKNGKPIMLTSGSEQTSYEFNKFNF